MWNKAEILGRTKLYLPPTQEANDLDIFIIHAHWKDYE